MTTDPTGPMENPYRPPRREADVLPISRATGIFGIAAAFSVDGHEIDLRFDVLSGNEQCCVDGLVVSARKAPLDFRTSHTFRLGPGGKQVAVRCRFWPLFPIRVTLEDTLLVDDLFPRHRTAWMVSSLVTGVIASVLLFLLWS